MMQIHCSFIQCTSVAYSSTMSKDSSKTVKQDFVVPEWLNKDYLLRVLETDFQCPTGEIKLDKFRVESATNKGDNYASEMFRITLEFSKAGKALRKRIILKKDHTDKEVNQYFEAYNLYSTEINYYRLCQPPLEKILRSLGETTSLSPRMIFYKDPVFIMEDMAELNYRTVDRMARFDKDTAKLVLLKLARLHATSMVYNRESGGVLAKTMKRNLFATEEGFVKILLKKLDILIEDMKSWGPEYSCIIPKMATLRKDYYKINERSMVPSEGMGVLLHGDAWVNNILIRFDANNRADDALLIDLQISSWSSPAIDLLYFMFTSLNEPDYQDQLKFYGFLKFYYDEFSRILRLCKYSSVPSLGQLHQEINSRLTYGKLQ